jgi:hypothetical protein
MVRYRNTKTGRIIERPYEDEWLEASSGWSREDADEPADFVPSPDEDEDDTENEEE